MIIFNFGTNLGLAGVKYLIKIIFHIKIEIGIFEILNVPYFNKFWAFLILGEYLSKIIFDIKIEIGIFEISINFGIWAINIGYRPMNFYISTNYSKNIRLGYYFLWYW